MISLPIRIRHPSKRRWPFGSVVQTETHAHKEAMGIENGSADEKPGDEIEDDALDPLFQPHCSSVKPLFGPCLVNGWTRSTWKISKARCCRVKITLEMTALLDVEICTARERFGETTST